MTNDQTDANWIETTRAAWRASSEEASPEAWAALDFCEKHGLKPTSEATVELWGFGEIPVTFIDPEGVWWTPLAALPEPTGIPYDRLEDLMVADAGSDEADWIQYRDSNDQYQGLAFVSGHFVLRLFAGESPWRREFTDNLSPLLRHGLIATGNDGGPIGAALTSDLISLREARERAQSGPAGALLRGQA